MKSQVMINQIKELHKKGHAIRKIARALEVSRNTVRRHLKQQAVDLQGNGSRPKLAARDWSCQYDWEWAIKEVQSGATILQVFKETLPPISYKSFCRALGLKRKVPTKPAPRIPHNPGEKIFIDFCDGILLTDRETGKKIKTHFFMGVLPFSSYSYGTFTLNQSLPSFIRAHETMWAYFRGVTPYVVVDNLKAGVKKAHRYDPDENPTYCDYGNHTGFAVLPARPYTPRDKASVESGIGVIQRTFFQEVRHEVFYSLDELNRRFREFLDSFNQRIMKDYGVSRADRFAKERDHLKPLPEKPYEICEWKTPKVHPDCCIQVDYSFYSVPFQYCGQKVRAKLTDKILVIYSGNLECIATHVRCFRKGTICVDEKHLPPWAMQNSKFEIKKCQALGEMIGPNTTDLFSSWFEGPRPLRYLRRAQGICRLQKDGMTRESIEYGVAQAVTFKKERLSYIKDCAKAFASRPPQRLSSLPCRTPGTIHLHGGSDHV
jgi:transposase